MLKQKTAKKVKNNTRLLENEIHTNTKVHKK